VRGRLAALDPWHLLVLGVALAAFCVRIVVIHLWRSGGYDLSIYRYFGRLAMQGSDPYTAPPHGAVPGIYGDNQPFELLLFGGLLRIHGSVTTLRYFFALLESATLLLVGFGYAGRSRLWRLAVMTVIGFSPFVLLSWTGTSEDKGITILLLVLLLVSIERGSLTWAWVAAIVLFVVKFESLFFLIPLVVHTWRERGKRYTALALAAFAGAGVLGEAPYFPESLRAFTRRSARIDYAPDHASWTIILNRLGLYDHRLIRPLIVLTILLIAVAFIRAWIDLPAAVVLSMGASFFFLPDESYDRILLIAVPLLLVITLTKTRLAAIWLVNLVSAAALYAVVFETPRIGPAPTWFRRLAGPYASVHHVVFMNLILVLLLADVSVDLISGRLAVEAAAAVSDSSS